MTTPDARWSLEDLYSITIPASAGTVAMSMSHAQAEPTEVHHRWTDVRQGNLWGRQGGHSGVTDSDIAFIRKYAEKGTVQ